MHALPGDDWVSAPLGAAIADADELALEVADTQDAAAVFAVRARWPGLPPLAERLPAAARPALAAVLDDLRLPAGGLDGDASWAAALAIGGAAAARAGARREHGVEAVLAARFRAAGKPVLGLETVAGQLAVFASLPETQQRVLLARTIGDAAAPDRYLAMAAAWRAGDLAALDARLRAGMAGAPGLRAALVVARNGRFANWAAARARRPGSALLAVGAGHMLGADGVPALLAGRGLAVRRVA